MFNMINVIQEPNNILSEPQFVCSRFTVLRSKKSVDKLIVHELHRGRRGHPDLHRSRVRVDTVDSLQGSEADIVILSFVRSSRQCGFLADERRLNVALTRAKRSLILVGRKSALVQSDASHIVSFMKSIGERNLFRSLPLAPPLPVASPPELLPRNPQSFNGARARGSMPEILPYDGQHRDRNNGDHSYSRRGRERQHRNLEKKAMYGHSASSSNAHAHNVPKWGIEQQPFSEKTPIHIRPRNELEPPLGDGPRYRRYIQIKTESFWASKHGPPRKETPPHDSSSTPAW